MFNSVNGSLPNKFPAISDHSELSLQATDCPKPPDCGGSDLQCAVGPIPVPTKVRKAHPPTYFLIHIPHHPHFTTPLSSLMSARQDLSTGSKWEPIIGYSRAVKVGNSIYVSGTTGTDPVTGQVAKGDVYAQVSCGIRVRRSLSFRSSFFRF